LYQYNTIFAIHEQVYSIVNNITHTSKHTHAQTQI